MAERASSSRDHAASLLRFAALAGLLIVSGCSGVHRNFVPAIFGLDNAGQSPYILGKVPEPKVGPRDTIIGLAAGFDGQCIYRRAGNQNRYRAVCPDGYRLGGPSHHAG